MDLKILMFLIILLMNSKYLAYQLESSPEERCAETGDGRRVCLDCFRFGTCLDNGDGTYSIVNIVECPSLVRTHCDDSLFSSPNYGQCGSYNPSSTNCSCNSINECIPDPNNPNAILHCELNEPVTDDPCPNSALDLTTCSCLSCSGTCPLVNNPDGDCRSYFFCSGTDLIQEYCPYGLCFDQTFCGCIGQSTYDFTTTEQWTSWSIDSTTTAQSLCPPGCPFVDDPNDEWCDSYFICDGPDLIQEYCYSGCFDQASCGCVQQSTIGTSDSTATTTAQSLCPPGCPFIDDPNDDCYRYFVCSGDQLIPLTCNAGLCFDQAFCGCVDKGGLSTEPSTISATCPGDCPFLDDPSDDCGRFFYCYNGVHFDYECPPGLCFDQSLCSCTELTTSTTEVAMTTTSMLTCPPGCPFVDDPFDECSNYFVCSGDEQIPLTCSGELCFDQASCGCVDKRGLSTEPSTTPATCPADCPFMKDPSDDCKSYFVCSGDERIPLTCNGVLCFDQTSCGCVDKRGLSTEPSTTLATCPADCPFLKDPSDDCESYFVCSGTELIPVHCKDNLCFEQASCGCVARPETSTELLPTPATWCPSDCPYIKNPNGDCGSYFVCYGNSYIAAECVANLCFDQSYCGCVERLVTTTELIPTPPSCPDDCPFVKNPNGDCGSYFVCSGDKAIPLECGDNLCFDQISCGCVTKYVTSPEPTTTQLTCPSGCPFVDDPYDECRRYFVCTDTGLFPVDCTDDFCFDQASCGCVERGGPTTCPPGCPFVDDTNDDCASYFICTGTDLIQFNCTGTSCFDQESCGCVERRDLLPKMLEIDNNITSLQNQVICNPECPFVDDPEDDCGRHYICNEDSLIPTQCPGASCFDQAACQCL